MSDVRVRSIEADELGERVILAIDTALGTSVAIGHRGRVVEVSSDNPRGHAESIGTLIERAFAESGLASNSVTDVVAGMGPGPFTGLRVGIAAAQAFALGQGLTILPLVSHDAVALDHLAEGASSGARVVQDAKRRELFVTDYAGLDWAGVPVRAVEPRLAPRSEFDLHDGEAADAQLQERSPQNLPGDLWPERVPAANLVRIAARTLAVGGQFEPEQALYLRLPDVMQPSRPKQVTA